MECGAVLGILGSIGAFVQSWPDLTSPVQELAKSGWDVVESTFQDLQHRYATTITWLQNNSSWIWGFLTTSFGLVQWLRYREKKLFRRLDEYLKADGDKISAAKDKIFDLMIRPSIGGPGVTSFDAMWSLSQVLERRRWFPLLALAGTETAADQYLRGATEALDLKETKHADYHAAAVMRAASAHLLCGATDASLAARTNQAGSERAHTQRAREHLARARRLPGNDRDVHVLEFEINLLLREREYDHAEELAKKLTECASSPHASGFGSILANSCRYARSLKYQAICRIKDNKPKAARAQLEGGLKKLHQHLPLGERHLLEKAQIEELLACVHKKLGYGNLFSDLLSASRSSYLNLRDSNDPWGRGLLLGYWRSYIRYDGERMHLYRAAKSGLARLDRMAADAVYFPEPFPGPPT